MIIISYVTLHDLTIHKSKSHEKWTFLGHQVDFFQNIFFTELNSILFDISSQQIVRLKQRGSYVFYIKHHLFLLLPSYKVLRPVFPEFCNFTNILFQTSNILQKHIFYLITPKIGPHVPSSI